MNYASWGARVGAYLIDWVIVLPFSVLAVVLDGPKVDPVTGQVTGQGPIYWVLSLLGLLVWGYNRWFQAGKTGRSWGRKALGISLVKDGAGQPIGAGLAFARDLAHVIDSLICLIGYLFPLWDAKKQTIADKLVKTVVVKG